MESEGKKKTVERKGPVFARGHVAVSGAGKGENIPRTANDWIKNLQK